MNFKKRILGGGIAALFLISNQLQAVQVDIGITLGRVVGTGSTIFGNAKVELGIFSGYTDINGVSFFTGKDYNTLRSSFSLLAPMTGEPSTTVSSGTNAGTYYATVDLLSTPASTRLFAWIFNASTASSVANWAIVSGQIGNSNSFNDAWLAPAPSATSADVIEAGTIYSQIYSSTQGASIVASTEFDPVGANISLVPEPTTGALIMIGAVGLVALRRLRKV